MNAMKAIKIGILPQVQMRERALRIARGDYKPKKGEPKIWFTSMKSIAEVLSDENRALLRTIAQTNPTSIAELANETGRQASNLSRTLNTMARYGLVDLLPSGRSVRFITLWPVRPPNHKSLKISLGYRLSAFLGLSIKASQSAKRDVALE